MSKQTTYTTLLSDLALTLEGETDEISVLANVTAAIREALGFFWVGFYRVVDGPMPPTDHPQHLALGPFQGSPACFRIAYGRGVCGTAWKEQRTIVVPDVHQFPGHIACSSLSRSEIVVPVFNANGDFVAELDIDSTELNTFDETDRINLEQLSALITRTIYN